MSTSFNFLALFLFCLIGIICLVIGFVVSLFIVERTYTIQPNESSVGSSLMIGCYSIVGGVIAGTILFTIVYWFFGATIWNL